MRDAILIVLGGGIGALTRWMATAEIARFMGKDFPWATLSVNVVGSFLMGIVLTLPYEKAAWLNPTARVAIATGFLGALTTFSTFSYETLELFRTGHLGLALVNAAGSAAACVLACALGVWLMTHWVVD